MYLLPVGEDDLRSLLEAMEAILLKRDPYEKRIRIMLDFQNGRFVSPLLLATVAAFIEKLRLRHDVEVKCRNYTPSTQDYISRMDFFKEVGHEYVELFQRHNSNGRFIPITRITEDNYIGMASQLTRIIQEQWDNIDDSIVGALDWSIAEIIDNVFNHSQTKINGFVTAQYFPNKNRIDFTVIDGGVGIPRRLRSREIYKNLSVNETLEYAVKQDVTVDPKNNKGAGLYYTKRIIEENRGTLRINSDKAQLMINGNNSIVSTAPKWSGTIVQLKINTNIHVNPKAIWANTPASFEAIMERDRELW